MKINTADITIYDRNTQRTVLWDEFLPLSEEECFTTEEEVKDFLLMNKDFLDEYKDTVIDVEYSWGNESINFTWER